MIDIKNATKQKIKIISYMFTYFFIAHISGMLGFENVTTILSFLTLMGMSKCTIMMLIPQVIAEAVKPEQFTSAMGIFMLAFGFANLSLGPIIGKIKFICYFPTNLTLHSIVSSPTDLNILLNLFISYPKT